MSTVNGSPGLRSIATGHKAQIKVIMAFVGCLLAFQYQFASHRMTMEEIAEDQDALYAKLNQISQRIATMETDMVELVKLSKEGWKQEAANLRTSLTSAVTNTMEAKDKEFAELVKQSQQDWQKESANLRTLLTTRDKIAKDYSASLIQEHRALPSINSPTEPVAVSNTARDAGAKAFTDMATKVFESTKTSIIESPLTKEPRALPSVNSPMEPIVASTANAEVPKASTVTETKAIVSTKTSTTKSSSYPSYPETKYTPHVNELLQVIENVTLHLPENASRPWPFDPHKYCPLGYHIFVNKPYSPPSVIECNPENVWCKFFQRLFEDGKRVLPYNVSVGESQADMIKEGSMAWGQCFASSGPGGRFSMNNFQDAKAQVEGYAPNAKGYEHKHARPWEKRHKIPVFRGHPRMRERTSWQQNPSTCPKRRTVADGEFGHRSKAVVFSLDNPDLLNARVSNVWHPCQVHNATNGMDRLFGIGKYRRDEVIEIPSTEYYTDYQVAVVLGGIGAAFRTPVHLSAGQAVVLQRFSFEEWYIPYMTPWVHYIPLKEDLSDLKEIMEWVRDNPNKVKSIALNGKKFYEEWLSFGQTNEHWHELLWRLSELIYHKGPERLKTGTIRTIWPGPIVPIRFIRSPATGKFVEEERSKTRQPYLDYDVPRGEKTQK